MSPRLSAVEREELKYAHLARRQTDSARRNRAHFEAYAAAIEPDPVDRPTGPRLELASRYRIGHPLKRSRETS